MSTRYSDPVFEPVSLGSSRRWDTSPRLEERTFRGIRLNAPAQVFYSAGEADRLSGAFAPVLVCGTCRFKYDTLGLNGSFIPAIVFVATERQTHECFAGRIAPAGNPATSPSPLPRRGLREADFADMVITEYFNPNLAQVLALPPRDADYVVCATLGPYTSNAVSIRVRRRSG